MSHCAGSRDLADLINRVDPELRDVLLAYHEATVTLREAADDDVAQAFRARADAITSPPLETPSVQRLECPGVNGGPSIAIYCINADPHSPRPLLVHLHGGGFISGSAKQRVPGLQVLAGAANIAIAAIEYRLAPETSGAVSVPENCAALAWLHANAEELGFDPDRIAIHGDSAGGGHAVLVVRRALDEGQVPVRLLALTYPMLDDRTGSVHRAAPHTGQWVWTERFNRIGWQAFLGSAPGAGGASDALVPARIKNLSDFPPVFLAVGDLDLFVEENLAFAARLSAAGVPLDMQVIPGAVHGFEGFNPKAQISVAYQSAFHAALKRAFTLSE